VYVAELKDEDGKVPVKVDEQTPMTYVITTPDHEFMIGKSLPINKGVTHSLFSEDVKDDQAAENGNESGNEKSNEEAPKKEQVYIHTCIHPCIHPLHTYIHITYSYVYVPVELLHV